MGTIEYTDKNFNRQIDILSKILLNVSDSFLRDKLKQLQDSYDSITVNILHGYYTENLSDAEKDVIADDYHKLILKESIHDSMQIITDKIKEFIKSGSTPPLFGALFSKGSPPKLLTLMREYEKIPAYRTPPTANAYKNVKQDELCVKCGGCMFMNNETSEMMCSECGEIQPIIGTVFDDLQIYYQEGPCSKHASYERIKHGEKWLLKIQAKENVDIKKEIINDVKRQIRCKDITDVRKVTHDLIRECLRKTGHTKFNEHISLIKKIITGISPPQLTEKEQSATLYYFDLVVEIFEQKKPKYKHNCPYHPFFIFKILEQKIVLKEDTSKQMNRKRRILSNIHIQSENTIKKRDKFWEIICWEIKEFVYIPTDRNKYKIPI